MRPGLLARLWRWASTFTFPFGFVITWLVVVSMLLLSLVLAYQVSQSAQQALVTASTDSARQISQLISERVRRIVDPADATIRLLASDPLTVAPSLPARLRRLPVLARLLQQNPLLSAAYVGYPDGQFFLVRPLRNAAVRERLEAPPGANYLVQSVASEGGRGGMVGRWAFYDARLQVISSRVRPDYRYDPRTRPWFAQAQAQSDQVLTAPYVFFTTQEIGVTLSQPVDEGGAILGLDVALPDLGRELSALRLLPRTEIALVDHDWRVLAYPDMTRVLERDGASTQLRLRALGELGVASLHEVQRQSVPPGQALRFRVGGEEWLGQIQPLESIRWKDLHILMAIPTSELLADLDQILYRQAWLSGALILLMLGLGGLAGRRLGNSLAGLASRAHALSHFDFGTPERRKIWVTEVRDLTRIMDRLSDTIQKFLDITHHISADTRVDLMLSNVLSELVRATVCTGGAVYLVVQGRAGLQCAARHGDEPDERAWYPEHLAFSHFINRTVPQSPDSEEPAERPSAVAVQLRTRAGEPLGLLVLHFAGDDRQDDHHFQVFVQKLSGTLSVAIETRNLIEGQRRLLDAVIHLLAGAIDAKSPYTGGHCERVPRLAEQLMQRMCVATEGPFAGVSMTDAERYEFHIAAWLHDCGKVTTPEHVIDKATKLDALYNRIHEVRMRFEVLWRDAELDYWQQRLAGGDAQALASALSQRHAQLQDDFAFVARCNLGAESMSDADVQRLGQLARQPWLRHFDHRLGLSAEEAARLAGAPEPSLPAVEPLLADRPEHVVPWGEHRPPVGRDDPANQWGFDMPLPQAQAHLGELHNLGVRRGTLTPEDRFRINNHIVQTIVMLSSLPLPPELARVPQIAGSHHEKLDGTGYPRRLRGEQLSLADRVMTLADIFEALTAADRPYKSAKTLSESLQIMVGMVAQQHIDAEVFRFFVRSHVWKEYADQYLRPEQRDAVDEDALLAQLPP